MFHVPCWGSGCFRAVDLHLWGFIPDVQSGGFMQGLQWEGQGKAPWKSCPSLAPAAPRQLQGSSPSPVCCSSSEGSASIPC